MNKSAELPLPCAHCEGENIYGPSPIRDGLEMGCVSCGSSMHQYHGPADTARTLLNKWNTRAKTHINNSSVDIEDYKYNVGFVFNGPYKCGFSSNYKVAAKCNSGRWQSAKGEILDPQPTHAMLPVGTK